MSSARFATTISIFQLVANASILCAQSVPPLVTDESPAAGKRVSVTAPEYVGTDVYHTLYLPTDWVPGGKYPVIVEYPPNQYGDMFDGTVDDTQLGFYQSGGEGFIWVTMPFIITWTDPPQNATTWWGSGELVAAQYTKTNLIRILEDFGGDPASVFLTGFSRGAIAAGQVGLRSDEMADIWLGMLPHSHHYQLVNNLSRLSGRASFVTYGDRALDGGAASSRIGVQRLEELGFPVESRELDGVGHTDEWIQDDASASSLAVRQEIRAWLADTIAIRPGTSSILGQVQDAAGNPLPGVRIQSGDTHWTFSDQDGRYELAGLIDGQRELTASHPNYEFLDASRQIMLAGADLHDQAFVVKAIPEPSSCSALVISAILLVARRRWLATLRPSRI